MVDQQKIRRMRTGLIAHDPALAQPGFTLFAPMYGDGSVFLIDMEGEVAHRWAMPYRPGLYAYLLDSGHLFYGGKVMDDLDRFEGWPRFKAGAALEVDWNGRVAWEVNHPDHHHDARKLKNGNVLLLCLRPLADDIARRVKGGLPGTEADGKIYADYLLEMTTAGQVVWEWRSWEHLAPETHPITLQDRRTEWTHGNTVAETADGNILVSFRNISTVVMIERANSSNDPASALRTRARCGMAARIFSTRSGAPMTPVELTRICDRSTPSSSASFEAMATEAGYPSCWVQQFALPELTITPRMRSCALRRFSRETITGAATI